MSLTRSEVQRAITRSPWTKDFRHTLPFPRFWLKRSSWQDPIIKSVSPKQRIKYWNIVPGDSISIRGDRKATVHEVLSINKFSNRVFLKGTVDDRAQDGKLPPSRNIHYSRCQLLVGSYQFNTKDGEILRPVFAHRIKTTSPHWNPFLHRYDWQRFAVKTIPTLPEWVQEKKPLIPWPKREPRELPPPTEYDTSKEAVTEITYQPPALPPKLTANPPSPPDEVAYIRTLFSPKPMHFDPSSPMEVHLVKELSNPHSRAKKQRRWKQWNEVKKTILREITHLELRNLNGRKRSEARADAVFKWKQHMEAVEHADKMRRRISAEDVERMGWKKAKKEKREKRKIKKLGELVLEAAPNQVIPASVKPVRNNSRRI